MQKHKLEVTDDVSIIEAMGKPVKITKGSYTNIKVVQLHCHDRAVFIHRMLADFFAYVFYTAQMYASS